MNQIIKKSEKSLGKHFKTKCNLSFFYNVFGDWMKVKVFDEGHEKDLESAINDFLTDDIELIDIKFSVAASVFSDEQVFCFSALVLYQ